MAMFITAEALTSKTDEEIYSALLEWFSKQENFFHSPFVKQVDISKAEDDGALKVTIREEMPLFLSYKLPVVAKAQIRGNPSSKQIVSASKMGGYEHVTVTVSFKPVVVVSSSNNHQSQRTIEIKETLDFKLNWLLDSLPLVGSTMHKVTKQGWLKAHKGVIQSLKRAVEDVSSSSSPQAKL